MQSGNSCHQQLQPQIHRSWLYVPGDRPDRVTKALTSAADAVVVDLEDAVSPDRKEAARHGLVDLVGGLDASALARLWVRINDPAGPWGEADLAAVSGLPLAGLRLPKATDPHLVSRVAEATGLRLQLLIESAAGLELAADLARAHPLVVGIGLGESDLAADLRVGRDAGLDWARGQVVMVSRAAGLASPVQSVWTDVADLEGLRTSSERGRELGFLGRSIIHPWQIGPVHEAYTPPPDQVATARATLAAAAAALARGDTALLDDSGRFIDPAVVELARVTTTLADSLNAQEDS